MFPARADIVWYCDEWAAQIAFDWKTENKRENKKVWDKSLQTDGKKLSQTTG